MRTIKTRLAESALTFVLGAAFAIAVGLLIFGSRVFAIHDKTFVFVSDGLAGAAAFAVYRLSNLKIAMAAAVVVAVILGLLSRGNFLTVFIHSIIFLLVVVAVCRSLWGGEGRGPFIVKMIYLAVALGFVGLIVTVILVFVYGGALTQALVFDNVILEILVGIGLGFGFEIAGMIGRVIHNAERAD